MMLQKNLRLASLVGAISISLGLFLLAGSEPSARQDVLATNDSRSQIQDSPVVAIQTAHSSSTAAQPDLKSHEATLRHKVSLLNQGRAFVSSHAAYTCKLRKQEVVRGDLLAEQTMFLKCRHQPFSVYLIWLAGDTGREVIYIDGQNDGKIIAHDGGWKARIPAFSLVPDQGLAMRDARYPVTTAGLVNFIDTMLKVHEADLGRKQDYTCEIIEDSEFENRPCRIFTTKYESADGSPVYRKSVTTLDKEWNLPLQSRHFEWPRPGTELSEEELDEATLIEAYSFEDLKLSQQLTDRDFDRTNPEYNFR